MKATRILIIGVNLILISVFLCGFSSTNEKYYIRIPEEMTFVDEGYYMMGAELGDLYAQEEAKPIHEIYTKAYYIDKYEVSNADYAECVDNGKCAEPQKTSSATREDYYNLEFFSRYPVVNITWQDAQDYCEYAGKRLPTEAEWEKAARGTEDSRRYSWGNSSPKTYLMNITNIPGDTEMPNSYSKGTGPNGMADVMGNVSEWTSDWYSADAYVESDNSKASNASKSGTEKVVRGDSYATAITELHITNRYALSPDSYSDTVGFRCAADVRERVSYDSPDGNTQEFDYERAYVKAGNESGIFLLENPGGGADNMTLIRVVPNGAIVEILGGPVQINYSDWYRVRTNDGWEGWTLSSALKMIG